VCPNGWSVESFLINLQGAAAGKLIIAKITK
jgi:hypothetical protein